MIKVLLIEDNLDILENTSEILKLFHLHVLATPNGNEGLSIALDYLPDVILCDVQMPVMDGFEVFKHFKANPITSNIPFIFFTANTEKKQIESAKELGVDGYLCKPFDGKDLLDIIHQALSKRVQKKPSRLRSVL
jgi:CheY-like chemotaxis protein